MFFVYRKSKASNKTKQNKKLLKLVNEFNKNLGYKINILKINCISILAVNNQKIKLREQLH